MMTLQQVSEQLKDRRLPVVAKATDIHYNTLQAIRDNPEDANPTYRVLKALSDYFEDQQA